MSLYDRLPDALTEDELQRIFSQPSRHTKTGIRNYAIMRFMADSGARVSEMIALELRDVELDSGSVHIWQGKGAKDRTVYIGENTINVIRLWLERRPKKGKKLFCTHKGTPLKDAYVRQMVYNYAEAAEVQEKRTYYNKTEKRYIDYLKVSPHSFRHTYATLLLRRGYNIREVQNLLGHSWLETTQVYTHVFSPELAEAAKSRPTLSF